MNALIGWKSLLLVSGALLAAQPLLAQPAGVETAGEVVTVTAPSVVIHESKAPAGSRATGGGMLRPIEVVSVNRSVSFADLDLTKSGDVAIFTKRIDDAAKDACATLDKRYPKALYIPVSPDENCAKNAAGNAMRIADQVIAAAKTR